MIKYTHLHYHARIIIIDSMKKPSTRWKRFKQWFGLWLLWHVTKDRNATKQWTRFSKNDPNDSRSLIHHYFAAKLAKKTR